jgi:hypothetical protein
MTKKKSSWPGCPLEVRGAKHTDSWMTASRAKARGARRVAMTMFPGLSLIFSVNPGHDPGNHVKQQL